jgi:hypothetical protein
MANWTGFSESNTEDAFTESPAQLDSVTYAEDSSLARHVDNAKSAEP